MLSNDLRAMKLPELYALLEEKTIDLVKAIRNKEFGWIIRDKEREVVEIQKLIIFKIKNR